MYYIFSVQPTKNCEKIAVTRYKTTPFKYKSIHCLFVWSFSSHSRELLTHMDTSQLPVKGCKFWPMLAIGQWGFFSVPHLLWHRASVYNGNRWSLRTCDTHTYCWAMELLLPDFATKVCRGWDTQPSACEAIALTDCPTTALYQIYDYTKLCYIFLCIYACKLLRLWMRWLTGS